jgi:hypothetical protein
VRNRSLVLCPLKFEHWLESSHASPRISNDNLEVAIHAVQSLLPLRFSYADACVGMNGEKLPVVKIRQQTPPLYRLTLRPEFSVGTEVPKLKVTVEAEVFETGQEGAAGEPRWRSLTIDMSSL